MNVQVPTDDKARKELAERIYKEALHADELWGYINTMKAVAKRTLANVVGIDYESGADAGPDDDDDLAWSDTADDITHELARWIGSGLCDKIADALDPRVCEAFKDADRLALIGQEIEQAKEDDELDPGTVALAAAFGESYRVKTA